MADSDSMREFMGSLPPPEASMGAMEAVREGIVGAVAAFLSGAEAVGGAIWDVTAPAMNAGNAEMASLLFRGDAFVMYGKGTGGDGPEQDQPLHGPAGQPDIQKEPEVKEQERGGMEM